MRMQFTKMQGAGNDFVVIDNMSGAIRLSPQDVARLCDRHFGIGADGVILVSRPMFPNAHCLMDYRNSDGSIAEMCGNGIRCCAKYVTDRSLVPQAVLDSGVLQIETRAGLKEVVCDKEGGRLVRRVRVDMGEPVLDPREIPTLLVPYGNDVSVLDVDVAIDDEVYSITAVSMGNPHCIIFVDDPDVIDLDRIGPLIENLEVFPSKTNVEFASVQGNSIKLRVWERGCGETLACGTGACATAVASALTGRSSRRVTVSLPGGDLDIVWDADNHVYMTGGAEEVFSGEITL